MIERYLGELARALPLLAPRKRILAEAEDHLRAAAEARGEEEAVAAFGPAAEVARAYAPLAATRLVALLAFCLAALPVLTYPIVENSLPPAPWPGDGPPAYLRWKQDAIVQLYLLAAVAVGVGAATFRRGGRLFGAAVAAAVGALGAMSVLGAVLSAQWYEAVPGTPGWLFFVPAVEVALAIAAAALLLRALVLTRTAEV